MDADKLHIYEILARQHEPMLMAYILSLVSDQQLAQDIAQDTFLIAYRKIGTLKDPNSFGAWLRGIARWEAFAAIRKRGRELSFEPAVFEGMEDVFSGLEQHYATEQWQERFEAVEHCFGKLPEKLKAVCQLHYLDDKKTQDVAELLKIGLSAVLKRLERARESIRECVEMRLKLHG